MNIPICPKCGSDDGVYQTGKMFGPVQAYFEEVDERNAELFIDNTSWLAHSSRVHCNKCLKIRPDLYVDAFGYLRIKQKP